MFGAVGINGDMANIIILFALRQLQESLNSPENHPFIVKRPTVRLFFGPSKFRASVRCQQLRRECRVLERLW